MAQKTAKIRGLNDEFRQYFLGGGAVITPGIAALGQEAVERIVRTIAVYDDCCHANDPHEEHDFGSLIPKVTRSCSRSIITIQRFQCIRQIQLIRMLLSA